MFNPYLQMNRCCWMLVKAVMLCLGDGTVSMPHWVWRTTVWRMWRQSLWESRPAVCLWVNRLSAWNRSWVKQKTTTSCLLLSLWLQPGWNRASVVQPWDRRVHVSDRSHRYFLWRVRSWIRFRVPGLQRVSPLQRPLGWGRHRCPASLPGAERVDSPHQRCHTAHRQSSPTMDPGPAVQAGQPAEPDSAVPVSVRGGGGTLWGDQVGPAGAYLAQSN